LGSVVSCTFSPVGCAELIACTLEARLASKEVAMPTKLDLGRRIREERVKQSLTLKEVESRSGVSATHISQIERGITWPTVNALHKVAKALDKSTSFFLEDVELPEVSKLRGDGAVAVLSEKPRLELRSLTTGIPGGRLHFYMLIADPADDHIDYPRIHSHEGDECGCVLSGKIEVRVGDEIFNLGRGDTIHFSGTKPHGIRNVGEEVSESIWTSFSLGM
jgi:transcriptional regulator with XRE-family HTH domain